MLGSHAGDSAFAVGMIIHGSAIVSDAAVILCTWVSVYMLGGCDGLRRDGRTPLVDVLLRDGTVYFCALLVSNIALLVVYSHAQSVETNLGPLVSAISSVIVSRFILDLRRVDEEREQPQFLAPETIPEFRHQLPSSTLRSNFLGNMGAALDGSFGFSTRSEDEPEDLDTVGGDHGLELVAVGPSRAPDNEGVQGEVGVEELHV